LRFYLILDFSNIEAWSGEIDDVTNYVTHGTLTFNNSEVAYFFGPPRMWIIPTSKTTQPWFLTILML